VRAQRAVNERCATEQQACLAFALYVDKGEDNWEIPRLPSTKTYSRIMNAFDASLKFEIKQAKEKCYG